MIKNVTSILHQLWIWNKLHRFTEEASRAFVVFKRVLHIQIEFEVSAFLAMADVFSIYKKDNLVDLFQKIVFI